jgi:DNA repair photolyase
MQNNEPKISNDLNAKIEFQETACNSYSIDLSIGCQHQCLYCHFSDSQKLRYRRIDKNYSGKSIPLNISYLLQMNEYPEYIYLSFSTDPFEKNVKEQAHLLLERLLVYGTKVLIITKSIIPDKTILLLRGYRDQLQVQMSIPSLNSKRNSILEPGAPNAEDRIENFKKLVRDGISAVARLDPLFPLVDDSNESLVKIIKKFKQIGTQDLIASYALLTRRIYNVLEKIELIRPSLRIMHEITPSVAKTLTYSVDFIYKLKKYIYMRELCNSLGLYFHVCSCKDLRLQSTPQFESSTCHPKYSPDDWKSFKANTFPALMSL